MKHSTHRNGIEEDTRERNALQGPRYNEINFCKGERLSSVWHMRRKGLTTQLTEVLEERLSVVGRRMVIKFRLCLSSSIVMKNTW
jgi:hypothetical protein